MRKLIVIESPFKGRGWWLLAIIRQWMNIRYARRCMRHSLMRMEQPLASHLLYTQPGILRDDIEAEREQGITAGLAWGLHAELWVFYMDRGMSYGMRLAERFAYLHGIEIEYRHLKTDKFIRLSGATGPMTATEADARRRLQFARLHEYKRAPYSDLCVVCSKTVKDHL